MLHRVIGPCLQAQMKHHLLPPRVQGTLSVQWTTLTQAILIHSRQSLATFMHQGIYLRKPWRVVCFKPARPNQDFFENRRAKLWSTICHLNL